MTEVAGAASDVVTRVVETVPEAEVVLVSPFSFEEPGPLTIELADELERLGLVSPEA